VPRGEGSGEAADESMPCEPIDDRLFEFTRASWLGAIFHDGGLRREL
jgi:hypothetical protein